MSISIFTYHLALHIEAQGHCDKYKITDKDL